ncbi:MAG: hypothetical protein ABI321_16570 [Polyangia bacterium]
MINGIWLALLGVLAVPSLILSKRPDAKDLLAKIAPYQGWIGVVSAFWGVWGIIGAVLHLNWLTIAPIFWVTWLADAVLLAALGFILGIGTMKTFIKRPAANAKMDETLAKLAPYQGRLGLIAVCVGIWMVVSSLLWSVG